MRILGWADFPASMFFTPDEPGTIQRISSLSSESSGLTGARGTVVVALFYRLSSALNT
ncbi:hypothetical protein [Neobacillus sp. FSL H8-0543]|uniref:hypothetical protein n=1 Tax=Neobacillus sp. FSL H8-0543 TaxID=2954672 RepID=UPI0031598C44